ncbi:RidA family protein [Mycolicibacterium sp.]|uniref:RidA family protein n=1 Tax=Mycolicibacterium sp. TaxID=2320850 RepID=UPI003D10B0F9
MSITTISVPEFAAWDAKAGVPVSFVTKANGFVFTAGVPPLDVSSGGFLIEDITAQTRRAMDNLGFCLTAAGTSFGRVVRCTVYATNAAYFTAINAVYSSYFPSAPPARTFVVVGSWPAPFDIEIDCVAVA